MGLILASFFISALLMFLSSIAMASVTIFPAIFIILLIIGVGILFDMMGTAVMSANISVLHAKASRKIFGAKKGVWLISNAAKVTSICNDVVGDICGIISGAASTMVVLYLIGNFDNSPRSWANLLVGSLVASLTIGGKAIGKRIALTQGNEIVLKAGALIQIFSKKDRLNA